MMTARHFKFTLLLILCGGSFGCAIGPLYSHETAQTTGQNHLEVDGGYGNGGYDLDGRFGVLKDLDLGIHWESLNLGVRAKYAFVNNHESGTSISAALGIGDTSGGGYYYLADFSASELTGIFEPYFTLRYVYAAFSGNIMSDNVNGS